MKFMGRGATDDAPAQRGRTRPETAQREADPVASRCDSCGTRLFARAPPCRQARGFAQALGCVLLPQNGPCRGRSGSPTYRRNGQKTHPGWTRDPPDQHAVPTHHQAWARRLPSSHPHRSLADLTDAALDAHRPDRVDGHGRLVGGYGPTSTRCGTLFCGRGHACSRGPQTDK